MRVIIAGGRNYYNYDALLEAVSETAQKNGLLLYVKRV
jgi:hypothetical protein